MKTDPREKRRASDTAYMRAWRAANPEKARAASAAYRARHHEAVRAAKAAYYIANSQQRKAATAAWRVRYPDRVVAYRIDNRERLLASRVAYRARNHERVKAYEAAYRARNPEKGRAASGVYRRANLEKYAHYQAARRVSMIGNGGSHTLQEWREKCALFAHLCAYCGEAKPLARDHKIPIARGGTDAIANIVPACKSCNSKKGTRTTSEYLAVAV